MSSKIRVLLVDDSPIALGVLKKLLEPARDIEVVGTARHGREGLELIASTRPTVVVTDYHMPVMNGAEFIRQVLADHPLPILVVSSTLRRDESATSVALLEAGAVDLFPKPYLALEADFERVSQEFIGKVRTASRATVFRRHRRPDAAHRIAPPAPAGTPVATSWNATRLIAIGASTGGPQALGTILPSLPRTLPAPVVCVQHISSGFTAGLVEWLNQKCALAVKVAEDGERALPGTIYFPPCEIHLELEPSGRLSYSKADPVQGHRPSVTHLFHSVARVLGPKAAGVLLTGMGEDGASGLLAMARAGAYTIAQDEASSVVFGMPKVAIELGAARETLPPERIGPRLIALCAGT
ncbi:MAG: chemotaxis response regulator protein-glutamate methylesterase [Verrucomicrobia bacterium]|nr:chemotaxis response regulator protein-glutamate methylesterase [Verrucomicrobiota bacterium]